MPSLSQTAMPSREDGAECTVAFIILHYKSAMDTHSLLRDLSIFAERSLYEVQAFVVDNSDDFVGTAGEGVAWAPLHVCVERPGVNLGFSAGVNRGVEAALTAGAEVLVVVNSDLRIPRLTTDALDVFISSIFAGPLQLRGCHLIRPDGTTWYAGGRVSTRFAYVRIERTAPVEERPVRTGFVTLAFCGMTARTWERLGGLDEGFFFGEEEWDLAIRAQRLGIAQCLDPRLSLVHGGSGSHDNSAAVYIYNGYRNKLYFHRKHNRVLWHWTWWSLLPAAVLARSILVARLHCMKPSEAVGVFMLAWRRHVQGPGWVTEAELEGVAAGDNATS